MVEDFISTTERSFRMLRMEQDLRGKRRTSWTRSREALNEAHQKVQHNAKQVLTKWKNMKAEAHNGMRSESGKPLVFDSRVSGSGEPEFDPVCDEDKLLEKIHQHLMVVNGPLRLESPTDWSSPDWSSSSKRRRMSESIRDEAEKIKLELLKAKLDNERRPALRCSAEKEIAGVQLKWMNRMLDRTMMFWLVGWICEETEQPMLRRIITNKAMELFQGNRSYEK
uniref:Uncharacterized protein n=1 Tax=Ditylenchus dipsaci TaxID=166011 RepID=A0A915E4Z2_9BILA